MSLRQAKKIINQEIPSETDPKNRIQRHNLIDNIHN